MPTQRAASERHGFEPCVQARALLLQQQCDATRSHEVGDVVDARHASLQSHTDLRCKLLVFGRLWTERATTEPLRACEELTITQDCIPAFSASYDCPDISDA